MAAFDQEEDYQRFLEQVDDRHQRVERPIPEQHLLGRFTIVCLCLNRTIGSGIFVAPGQVLKSTGSLGASLLVWALGAIIQLCGLLIWLELGLSVPFHRVNGSIEEKSVPRSGGEKNYLEFLFPKPKFLAICMFGIPFVILGNLSGNSIAIGSFVMDAANRPDAGRGYVIAIALAVLTLSVLLHICSRRGGILVSNVFAVLKVLMLAAIIVLGFLKTGGVQLGDVEGVPDNFDPETSFDGQPRGVRDYADALLYVLYTFSGFSQPFYVLSELRKPREYLPKYSILAWIIATSLFMLVNVVFFLVVPKHIQLQHPETSMATLFFGRIFGDKAAGQALSGLVAMCIFGNLVVMTFTASRVKQEIAKEGILPASLFFATSHTTPVAWWKKKRAEIRAYTRREGSLPADRLEYEEQSPMAALGLHWFMSVLGVCATAKLEPSTSWNVLVRLYSYVIVILIPMTIAAGLLFLKSNRSEGWSSRANIKMMTSPFHVILFFMAMAFVAIASFLKPEHGNASRPVVWWLIPTIGVSASLWGVVWYLGLKLVEGMRGRKLEVTRTAFIVSVGNDQWVQHSELVDHEWLTVDAPDKQMWTD